MTIKINANALRRNARALNSEALTPMKNSIVNALIERNAFETRDGTVVSGDAWFNTHKRIAANLDSLARLFTVANVTDARNVICRKLTSKSMFNAYALDKMIELARFVDGGSTRLQNVTKAFIACAIVATDNGMKVLPNDVNQLFLKRAALTASQVLDADLRDKLNSLSREHCSNSEATQSSQMRCVLEVLGFVKLVSDNRSRGAIAVDTSHSFIKLFRASYMVDAVAVAA